MADNKFEDPRLAAVYDPLEPDRSDLDVYAAIAAEFGARRVLDIGCGTGSLAVLLAGQGYDVAGVDPAAASLDVARAKPHADRVRWIHGVASDAPPGPFDLATMTGNVAQAIVDPDDWDATLAAVRDRLRPGGRLVFETRDPAQRAWEGWGGQHHVTDVPGVGIVEDWDEVTAVDLPLVTFVGTIRFDSDGAVLESTSTLRFRERDEVAADLDRHGLAVVEVRDAPDRPGLEFVFVAERRADGLQ